MAMFTSIRADKFCRHVNTYHCRINDKWYSGENMLTILKDAFSFVMFPMKTRIDFEMELDEFLKYLNLYLNKNRNYCIDFLQSEIVEPIIDNFKHSAGRHYGILESFGISSDVRIVRYEDYELTGYCCEDCDGNYERAKSNSYQHHVVDENVSAYKKAFTDYLHGQKETYKYYTIEKKEIR